MKCPNCSKEMESGYMFTPNAAFRSVRWSTEWARDMSQTKGEEIAPPVLGGSIKISGFRCNECKLLVLSY